MENLYKHPIDTHIFIKHPTHPCIHTHTHTHTHTCMYAYTHNFGSTQIQDVVTIKRTSSKSPSQKSQHNLPTAHLLQPSHSNNHKL